MVGLEGHEFLLLYAAHQIRGRAVAKYCQIVGGLVGGPINVREN